jgi:hypothetical protein
MLQFHEFFSFAEIRPLRNATLSCAVPTVQRLARIPPMTQSLAAQMSRFWHGGQYFILRPVERYGE